MELSSSVNPLPERLEQTAREIASDLYACIDDLAKQWHERMAAVPELAPWNRPELRDVSVQNARLDIGRELAGLINGRSLPAACPEEVTDSARLSVAMEFPLWA